MRKGYWIIGIAFLLGACNQDIVPKKFEFRGAWVATVKNIDWPSRSGLDPEEQRNEFRRLARYHADVGMNALIVQVRPATDALFMSGYEPWSQWLNGEQGKASDPFYDPMQFMIQETHNQGMEFHAWLNPYRALMDFEKAKPAANHITQLKPGWFVKYGQHLYFDPGIPEVRDYLVEVIREVVRNYNVDAIHFDDYFYPYKIAGLEFPDSISFHQYGRDFSTIENWRRNNVNNLVRDLHQAIKDEKPWVKFGISPFGVWRNQAVDPSGSATRAGVTNYDDLYADILLWLKNGWVDYITPQLYWNIGYPPAAYEVLTEWWNNHSFGRHVYIGQASYKIGNETPEGWKNPMEMPRHLRLNDKADQVKGDIYFNTSSILKNQLGFSDSLRTDFYKFPAFTPPMEWIDDEKPLPPSDFTAFVRNGTAVLNWAKTTEENGRFVVYRFKGKKIGNLNDPGNIIAVLDGAQNFFTERGYNGLCTYVITQLDHNNNESVPSKSITLKVK